MKQILLTLLSFIALCAGLLAVEKEAPFVGEWHSFEMGGGGLEDNVKSIVWRFLADGTFTASGTRTDGKVESYAGRYKFTDSTFELIVKEQPVQKGEYTLEGEVFTMRDPALKSWVKFKRAAKKPSPEGTPK